MRSTGFKERAMPTAARFARASSRLAALFALLAPALACAADAPAPNKGDTAWMLTSTALVLLMSVPGLALFYGGLVRTKNMLSVLVQVFVGFSLVTVLWCIYGYSLAFTEGNSVIGGFSRLFLRGTFDAVTQNFSLASTFSRNTPLYELVYVAFQGTFAGLVGAFVLGKRVGFGREPMAPHSLTMTMIGASLLWFGWFGFNAGSALEANGSAALAFMNTYLATACAVLSWTAGEWVAKGKPSMHGAASGAVAGLVAITPAAGNVGIPGAFAIGLGVGLVCLWGVTGLKRLIRADDSLDVFGVHAIGGIFGALMTRIFNAPALGRPGSVDWATGAVGYPVVGTQFLIQLEAVCLVFAWTD